MPYQVVHGDHIRMPHAGGDLRLGAAVRVLVELLLLRHELVWDTGAWTAAHEAWLRVQRFDRLGRAAGLR